MSLSALSIRRPVTTAMFFSGVSLLGLISLDRLQVELMPEVIYPEIFVAVSQQGMAPEQIERELVMPIEEEISQLVGVVEMTSTASLNRGNVRISYEPGTDMKFALLQVQSRMDRLQPSFPTRTQISVQRFDANDLSATVMELQVLAAGADLNWLRDYTEEHIAPELAAVEGVVSAQVLGGQQSAVEIVAEPERLQAYRLTMSNLRNALADANQPRVYLGEVDDGNEVFPVSFQGQFRDLRQIDETLIDASIPLRLGDVAEVDYGLQQRTDLRRVNGQSAVGILIQKEDEANLIAVADAATAAIAQLNRDFAPEGVSLIVTNNQAALMEDSLDTLKQAALVGLALGLVVLFLFLRNARFVAILLLAIPASLLATFNLMYAADLTLNVLSLCGLALAMGMLTDNSIVVMESIFKHFERGKSPTEAARDGTEEVSRAVIAATATTVLVFLPVLFIQSDFQDILRELALAITFPLLASLLVALALVPALAARTRGRQAAVPLGTGRLMGRYALFLKASLRHRGAVAGGVFLALCATLVAAFFFMLQQEVIAEETQFSVYASLDDGATLDATDEVMQQIEDAVRALPGIERFTTSVQEGQGSVTVMLQDRDERPERVSAEALQSQLDGELQKIQGALIGYQPQASSFGGGGGRTGGRGGRTGGTGGFNLQAGATSETALLKGYDFAVLQMIADDLSYRLEELAEIDANSVRPDLQRSAPEIQVIPRPLALFDHDLRVNTVLSAIANANPEGFAAQTEVLLLGLIALVLRVHRTRAARRETPAVHSIRLQTLTKIYGAPKRFRREWMRFDRRDQRLRAQGIDPVDRKAIRDGLSWKLPLLALLCFLHAYFEDALWLYLLSLATWGLVAHVLRQGALLGLGQGADVLARWAVPLLVVGYVHWRLALPSLTVASLAVWLGYRGVRLLADRVRRGQVDPATLTGRMAWLTRRAYRGVAALPLVGVDKPQYQALYGVNLEIGRGMFGLLGPNGAGKTTLMRIICQVLEPSSGSVAFDGVNVTRHGAVQGLIGYLPQHLGLYEHLTAYQYLEYRALLEGFREPTLRRARVSESLEQVNLDGRQNDPIGSFSGGMKQRVGIAQTLLHLPQIIVVDEPTAGLDPVERIRFRNLLTRISQQRIVLFSTHIVEDISGSCNRLAVLNAGRILYEGTPQAMRDLARGHAWEAVVSEEALSRIDAQVNVISHLRAPDGIRVRFLAADAVPGIAAAPVEPTLEDAYIYVLRSKEVPGC